MGPVRHLLSVSLNRLEARLDPARFLRIHRTHIVNLDQVRAFRSEGKGRLVAELETGELFVTFDTHGWDSGDRALELGGITRDSVPVKLPRIELDSGSRWFFYRAFP